MKKYYSPRVSVGFIFIFTSGITLKLTKWFVLPFPRDVIIVLSNLYILSMYFAVAIIREQMSGFRNILTLYTAVQVKSLASRV